MSTFRLLVSDVAGTIVRDDGLVIRCFSEAIQAVAPERFRADGEAIVAYATRTMGQSKADVFGQMLSDPALASQANGEFDRLYRTYLDQVEPIDGALDAIRTLRAHGVRVVLNTGFTRETLDSLLSTLNWEGEFDGSVTPAEAGAGRPSPLMIERSMHLTSIDSPEHVAVVGDTLSDIESARAAGVGMALAVLTGAHSEEVLKGGQPDHIVDSVADAVDLLLQDTTSV